MKLARLLTGLGIAFSLVACGSDDLSEEESQQAFAAALSIGTLGSSEASLSVEDDGSFTFSCPGGGTATFSGTTDDDGERFDWTIRYNDCVSSGLTINGSINYSGEVMDDGATFDSSFVMDGVLEFSGDVEGSCELDVRYTTSSSGTNVTFDYEGSICGYDASIAGDVDAG
ncbi:MAG: hypothetical protein AAFP04_10870 [Myxococcota bacterium]